jgi:hypothetical protein
MIVIIMIATTAINCSYRRLSTSPMLSPPVTNDNIANVQSIDTVNEDNIQKALITTTNGLVYLFNFDEDSGEVFSEILPERIIQLPKPSPKAILSNVLLNGTTYYNLYQFSDSEEITWLKAEFLDEFKINYFPSNLSTTNLENLNFIIISHYIVISVSTNIYLVDTLNNFTIVHSVSGLNEIVKRTSDSSFLSYHNLQEYSIIRTFDVISDRIILKNSTTMDIMIDVPVVYEDLLIWKLGKILYSFNFTTMNVSDIQGMFI